MYLPTIILTGIGVSMCVPQLLSTLLPKQPKAPSPRAEGAIAMRVSEVVAEVPA